jgi:predicted 3-demethylubiquinone-9 3-methyltransferase (glyoxalase superfamily)
MARPTDGRAADDACRGRKEMIDCADQAEIDRFWDAFSAGGQPVGCGWIRDRFGVTWQVTSRKMDELLAGPDRARTERTMQAMSQMVKIDIAALQAAYDWNEAAVREPIPA